MRWTKLFLATILLSPLATTACGAEAGDDGNWSSGSGATPGTGAAASGGWTGVGSTGNVAVGASDTGGSEGTDTGGSDTGGSGGSAPGTGGEGALTGGAGGATGAGGMDSGSGGASDGGSGGSGGASDGGSGGAGGSDTGGSGGIGAGGSGGSGDCNTPPPASPLVGWASVSGNGVSTTTGGGNAAPVTVTTLSELRAEVSGTAAKVIHVRGVLDPGDITVGSNKTIVGLCGATIRGHLRLSGSVNVIVRNIAIVGYGSGNCALDPDYDSSEGCSSGKDAVAVMNNAHHIWFDHCAVSDGTDGNLDITNGANYVTISWTKFHYKPRTDNQGSDSTGAAGHRYSNLVGGTDNPSTYDDANALNVTWHHNWWAENVVERQPRVRFGRNHIFNNLYTSDTTSYCVRAGKDANILLQGNYFDGVKDAHEFNNSSDRNTAHITAGNTNTYVGVTGERAVDGGGTPFTNPPYTFTLESAATARTAILAGAGPQ